MDPHTSEPYGTHICEMFEQYILIEMESRILMYRVVGWIWRVYCTYHVTLVPGPTSTSATPTNIWQ